MFDRSSTHYWLGRFAIGVALLIAAGLGLVAKVLPVRDSLGLISLAAGLYGFRLAYTSIGPFLRAHNYRQLTQKQWNEAAQAAFARASLPRRVFYLLVAVAEADGPIQPGERELVRRFLLERFGDPVHADEIQSWEMRPLPVQDRVGLAARIANGLDEHELDTLFCWCALVTFADGRFRQDEHAALHDVATGLGIPGPRARMLFHLARAQFLAGDSGRQRQGEPQRPAGARADALAVLGLPLDATAEQIRRRHRELVRRFHPDAQPNLGEVAQREARERFHAIQRAYEVLTS